MSEPLYLDRKRRGVDETDELDEVVEAINQPVAIFIAQQQIVDFITREIAAANDLPIETLLQGDATVGLDITAVHQVQTPATIILAQENVGLAVAVEIPGGRNCIIQILGQVWS